jgi:NAD(P)-dependent dehydrogenase (short-subunit alcohol dehydrogenase family)
MTRLNKLGGLDILVNNAARQIAQTSIKDISAERFDKLPKFGADTPIARSGTGGLGALFRSVS